MLQAFSVTFLVLTVYLHHGLCYNTNRQIAYVKENNCGYYDNPVFKATPILLTSRMGETQPSQPVILIDNRLRKAAPYYNTYKIPMVNENGKYQPKAPASYFPNMAPVDSILDLQIPSEHSQEEDEDIKIDYDKLWKVGEIPVPTSVKTLPDVYIKPEDAPAIMDMMSVERSELTEETHDLEDVELEEKYLSDPVSKVKEVIIERVSMRPEPSSTVNPAIAMFKENEVKAKINESQKGNLDKKEIKKKDKDIKIPSVNATIQIENRFKPNKDSSFKETMEIA